ncbi:MAG: FtsX-like permease family protein [Rikenellaceae bacterium]
MSTPKIKYSKLLGKESRKSKVAKTIAVIATALSVAIVIISTIVADGFRGEIENKTVSLMHFAHIREISQVFITSRDVKLDDSQIEELNQSIAPQELISVIETQGVLQNSVNLAPTTLRSESTDTITPGNIVLSKTAAKLLNAKVGDHIDILSLDSETPQQKRLKVSQIYSTGIVELEALIARISPQDIKEMVDIEEGWVSYYAIEETTPLDDTWNIAEKYSLDIETTDMMAPQIYGWLMMIDNNLTLVLIIMIIVAIINIITSTLIVMLDSTKTIATLRALGLNRRNGIRIFFMGVGRYAFKGMLWGIAIAIGLGILQDTFTIITLDEVSYFVNKVPIAFNWLKLASYIALMSLAITLSLLTPISIVTRINIAAALKYQ